MAQCKAKSKRSGQQCQQPAMRGSEVCYMHGGKTPKGIASPHFKTGRWSNHLTGKLAAKYHEIENDDTLLSLRDDIRLSDALLRAKFEKLDTGESGEAWKLMRKAVDGLWKGIDREDFAGCMEALREMRDVIDQRVAHYATETEIRAQLEQRRRLVETETKLTTQGEQAISVERLMLFVGALAGILRTHIQDAPTLTKIQSDIGVLISASETAG